MSKHSKNSKIEEKKTNPLQNRPQWGLNRPSKSHPEASGKSGDFGRPTQEQDLERRGERVSKHK